MADTRTVPSVAEVDAGLPADLLHREIVDGRVILIPGAKDPHQKAQFELTAEVAPWSRAVGAEVRNNPFDVHVSRTRVRQPDLLVVLAEHVDRIADHGMVGPPDLVVEVLSDSTRGTDLVDKRAEYAAFGVAEYWCVDLAERRVLVFRPLDAEPEIFGADATLTSALLPGLSVDLARVL